MNGTLLTAPPAPAWLGTNSCLAAVPPAACGPAPPAGLARAGARRLARAGHPPAGASTITVLGLTYWSAS
jgi:hypothetical protein